MLKTKIAFCNRPSYDNPLGGDAIQMLQTKKYLEQNYGITVDIVTDPQQISTDYSIVHVFNYVTHRVTSKFMERAHSLCIPIVSSCIYWDYSYAGTYLFYALGGYPSHISSKQVNLFRSILGAIGRIAPKPVGVSLLFRSHIRRFVRLSTYIAPNSLEESNLLLKFSNMEKVGRNKIRVVYNGVQLNEYALMCEADFFEKYKLPHGYILQVGRIEYLKNQLNLLYSMKDNPEIPIVFVGQVHNKRYQKRLLQLAHQRGNVFFIDKVEHGEISSFYKYAALHVLLSLRESPGLVSLEAISQQCPIVVSDSRFVPLDTYFQDTPYIANPLDVEDIRKVVLRAYVERKITSIDMNKFSWSNVASQTYQIYKEILK